MYWMMIDWSTQKLLYTNLGSTSVKFEWMRWIMIPLIDLYLMR